MERIDRLRLLLDERAERVELVRHPPLSNAEVEQLEVEFGCRLPEEYRQILTEIGPFEDDCGFQITAPGNFTGRGAQAVTTEEMEAFGRELWTWSQSRDDLFLVDGALDSVVEKRFPAELMARFDPYHGSAGMLHVAQLDGVSADLYLSIGGESRGSLWFVPEVGVHPEVFIRDGEVHLHDMLSWAFSFDRL